jgi:hypothetical protein
VTVGYPINKATIDSRAGYLVKTLRDTLEQAATLKGVLDGLTTQQLVAMGYDETTNQEVSVLKSALTDLYNLGRVANGQAAQSPANNFFFWAARLTGVE